jgi:hypothetical protein
MSESFLFRIARALSELRASLEKVDCLCRLPAMSFTPGVASKRPFLELPTPKVGICLFFNNCLTFHDFSFVVNVPSFPDDPHARCFANCLRGETPHVLVYDADTDFPVPLFMILDSLE